MGSGSFDVYQRFESMTELRLAKRNPKGRLRTAARFGLESDFTMHQVDELKEMLTEPSK